MKNPRGFIPAGILFKPNLLPQRKTKQLECPMEQGQIDL